MTASVARELSRLVGSAHVLAEPAMLAGYVTDWTRRYRGTASCVVRPGSADQVADVLRWCGKHAVPVIPQGGNTGLVGGSVPGPPSPAQRNPPVVVSTRRLTALGQADRVAAEVTAGAGVTIEALRARAAAAGLEYGVDLASRGSATVGGTIATNAGGIHAVRYGATRAQLLGVTACLAGGAVLNRDLTGPVAGSAGYDLAQLLAGSEGTLGIVTAARLRLWPAEPVAAVILAGVAGIGQAAEVQASLRASGVTLRAVEYLDGAGLDLVCGASGLPRPLDAPHAGYLLAEIGGSEESAERLPEASLPAANVVATGRRDRAALWAYRERLAEAISLTGISHKIDVTVPVGRMAAFRAELDGVLRPASAPGAAASVIVFGHIGVGNLHVNVLGLDPADESADQAVARLAVSCGGSVSAEHGIGRAKASWLAWGRPAAEVSVMRAIKAALDPAGLLNPGVLLPLPAGERRC